MSVLHAALGEASRGLQPDHSSGRGGRGAVVRLPRHHRPSTIAQVRKRLMDSPTDTHRQAQTHIQIKGITRH